MKFTRMFYLLLIVLAFIITSQNSAQTQGEMNDAANNDFKIQDDELNKVYKEILNVYKDDSLFIIKFKAAQKAWLIFRDAHLKSIFPEDDISYYGSVYTMCYSNELAEITKKRVDEISRWVKGTEEGDICAGSIRIKSETDEAIK